MTRCDISSIRPVLNSTSKFTGWSRRRWSVRLKRKRLFWMWRGQTGWKKKALVQIFWWRQFEWKCTLPSLINRTLTSSKRINRKQRPVQYFVSSLVRLILLCILIAKKPKIDGNKEELTNQKHKTYVKELSTILKKIIRIWGQMLLI